MTFEIMRVQKIADEAHRIYQERTKRNLPGDQMSDWLLAEERVDRMDREDRSRYFAVLDRTPTRENFEIGERVFYGGRK